MKNSAWAGVLSLVAVLGSVSTLHALEDGVFENNPVECGTDWGGVVNRTIMVSGKGDTPNEAGLASLEELWHQMILATGQSCEYCRYIAECYESATYDLVNLTQVGPIQNPDGQWVKTDIYQGTFSMKCTPCEKDDDSSDS